MGEGIPLHGDRSAWNTTDYASEHAKDINDAALLRHNAAPSAAGNVMRDNGSNWVSVAANRYLPFAPSASGDMIVGSADATPVWQRLALAGNAGVFLRRGAANNVEWSTLTLPNAATTGDILCASGANAIGNLVDVAVGQPLLSGGVGAVPAYAGFYLTGTPDTTYDLDAMGGAGSGTAGRVAQWAAGGTTLEDSNLIGPAANILTITNVAAATLALAITASKTLTLTCANDYNLTVPATGTATLGTGTASYIPRWSTTNTLGNSTIQDNGTTAAIGVASVANQLFTIKAATTTNGALTLQTGDDTLSKNLLEFKNSTGTVLTSVAADGHIGFGAAPYLYRFVSVKPTLASASAWYGFSAELTNSSSGTLTGMLADVRSSGSPSALTGVAVNAYNTGSGSMTAVYGLLVVLANTSTGTITTAVGFDVGYSNVATSTTTTYKGVNIQNVAAAVTNQYGLYIESQTLGSSLNYALYTNVGLIRFGDQASIVGSADRQQLIVTGYSTQAVGTGLVGFTRNNTTAGLNMLLALTNLGSGAAGDGGYVEMLGKSSTTAGRAMARISWLWSTATDASRKADLILSAYDTAVREGIRIRGGGSAAYLGFFGATPIARPTVLTSALSQIRPAGPSSPDYDIQSLTQDAPWGFVDEQEGETVLSCIQNLQIRVDELETKLSAASGGLGLIA